MSGPNDQFDATSAVIGKAIITLEPTCDKPDYEHRVCKRRIVGRAVVDIRDYIVVLWTYRTHDCGARLPNLFVLLEALPGVQNPSGLLELIEDVKITMEDPLENRSTASSKIRGEWISRELDSNLISG